MKNQKFLLKKQPLQDRAKFTVSTIKQAAAHVLRENGLAGFTTNAVAERAGFSIGSLYQYFPSKEVLIAELKRDHFQELRQSMRSAYENVREGSLEDVVDAFIEASIAAHQKDPELHRVLSGDLSDFVVKEDDEGDGSVRRMVEAVLQSHKEELRAGINITHAANLSYRVVEQLTHDAVLNNPQDLQDDNFVKEIQRMIIAYLRE